MRKPLLAILLGCLPALALDPEDVMGFWTGELVDQPGSQVEIFLAADGKAEWRSSEPVLDGGGYFVTALGDWRVKEDSLDIGLKSGWTVLDADKPEPFAPDTADPPRHAEVFAGNPRRMEITECLSAEECLVQELSFGGSAAAFTLPAVTANSAVRRALFRRARTRSAWGNPSVTVRIRGGLFDLRGRSQAPSR